MTLVIDLTTQKINMTTEKLQRLAKNFSGLITDKDLSLEDLFFQLTSIKEKYKEYFLGKSFQVQDFIKLLFFLFSYLRTGKFDLGQKYLNNIFFVSFFLPTDQYYTESCRNCEGDGRVDCSSCDYGNVECEECEGGGNVPDEDAEEEENGDSLVTCPNCEGDGTVSCGQCDGSGRDDCYECGGNGEIETNDNEYTVRTYLSWNPELKNIAELKYDDKSSIDFDELDRLTDDMSILFSEEEGHGELRSFVKADEYYTYYLSDEGDELYFNSSGNILNTNDPDYFLLT